MLCKQRSPNVAPPHPRGKGQTPTLSISGEVEGGRGSEKGGDKSRLGGVR